MASVHNIRNTVEVTLRQRMQPFVSVVVVKTPEVTAPPADDHKYVVYDVDGNIKFNPKPE